MAGILFISPHLISRVHIVHDIFKSPSDAKEYSKQTTQAEQSCEQVSNQKHLHDNGRKSYSGCGEFEGLK